MRAGCHTVGLTVAMRCERKDVSELLTEALAGMEEPEPGQPALSLVVEPGSEPFAVAGWEPLTRGAWRNGTSVVLEDACSSGFDLLVVPDGGCLLVRARRRTGLRGRAAAVALHWRHHLLVRYALLQYPALFWAGVQGLAPLHVSAFTAGSGTVLLAGPGGTGKSTLMQTELAVGGCATSDNVCVSDGTDLHGLLEPLRIAGGSGRRMPYGRREVPWSDRAPSLRPDRALVLRRGSGTEPELRAADPMTLARALVTGTYAAGELRRYWAFAATLALGTGLGPAHPPVTEVAATLAARLPCHELVLPGRPGVRIGDVLRGSVARA